MAIDRDELIRTHDPILRDRLARLAETRISLADGGIFTPPNPTASLEILDRLVEGSVQHIEDCRFRSVVVPASGGADSTFLLWILRQASDRIKDRTGRHVPIIGFTLPCTLQDDAVYLNDMGLWACELYADDHASVDVGSAHRAVTEALFQLDAIEMASGRSLNDVAQAIFPDYPEREVRVDRGNIAAHLRMIFAYGIAKRLGGAQCSTDNLSEGYTGFWTLCGDEGTFKYIQGILKGLEEPALMAAAGIPSPFIVQLETDGLGIAAGDVSQLYGELFDPSCPQTYHDVDTVIVNDLGGAAYPDPKHPSVPAEAHPVVRWNRRTEFKRNVFCLGRQELGMPNIPGLTFAV